MRSDERAVELLEQVVAGLERVSAGFATFHNAVRLQAARTVQVLGAEDRRLVSNAAGRLLGWSFHETASAPASIVLRDARGPGGGDILAYIDLPAEGSETVWLAPHGVAFTAGVYVDLVAGAAQGTTYLGTDQA